MPSDNSYRFAIETTADTSAIAQVEEALDSLRRGIAGAGDRWEELGKTLAQKFSLPDFGAELLKGLGLDSAFSVIETIYRAAERRHEEFLANLAAQTKAFEDRLHGIVETDAKLKEREKQNTLNAMTPEQRLAVLKAEAEKLKAQMDQQAGLATEAANVPAKLVHNARYRMPVTYDDAGQPDGGDDVLMNSEKAENDYYSAWNEAHLKANERYNEAHKKLLDLQPQINAANREVAQNAGTAAKAENETQTADVGSDRNEPDAVDAAREKSRQSGEEIITQRKKAADVYRSEINLAAKFAEETRKINEARGPGGLTDAEADAAIAQKRAEIYDEAGQAIRKAREEVDKYNLQLSALDHNPALSDQEKAEKRVKIINDQADAIKRVTKNLDDFAKAHPGLDVGGLTSAMEGFSKQGAENAGRAQPRQTLRQRDDIAVSDLSDPSKHYQSAGAGMLGGLQQQLASLGTAGDRVAKTIQTSIGGAFDAVSKNLTGLIMGTENWHDALRNIYNTIATNLVEGIVKMFTEWVEQRAIAGVASMLWSAREGAADTEAKTPGAVLGSISSFGVAAVVGVAAIVAAMAAFGGFAEGGFTSPGPLDRPAGVVHAGEWVAPQWQVAHPVYGPMIATLEAARRGSPGFSGGGFFNEWSGVGGAVGAFTKAFLPTYKTNPWQAFLNVLDYGEHPPGGDRLINSLMLGQAVPNDDSTSAWSWDASTQSWIKSTANVAGAMTTPYQSDASDGTAGATGVAGSASSGAGTAGGSTTVNVALFDDRNTTAYENFIRDPRAAAYVMSVVQANRRSLGIKI